MVQSAFYKPGWSIWTRGDSEVQFLGKVFDAIYSIGYCEVAQVIAHVQVVDVNEGRLRAAISW